MARGEKELRCLDKVQSFVFPNSRIPTVEGADMSLLHSSVFGFSLEDWQGFCGVLVAAEPNSNSNEFPDFISGDSLLEHFEISGTQEGRKGSTFKRKHEPFLKLVREEVDAAMASDEPESTTRAFRYPGLTYLHLLDSLERNLISHIESLDTFVASHKVTTSVFIIEHQECGLGMFENTYADVGEGRVFGDMRKPQKFENYRLSRDGQALKLLYGFSSKLDIVIFVGADSIEVIKLNEIPNMLKLMPWPFVVAAGPTFEQHSFLTVLQVVEETKEQDDNEQD